MNLLITLKVRVIVKSYFEFALHHSLSDSVFKFFPAPVEEGTDTIIVDHQLGGGDGKLKTNDGPTFRPPVRSVPNQCGVKISPKTSIDRTRVSIFCDSCPNVLV